MRGSLTKRFVWWAFVLRQVDLLAARCAARPVPGRLLIVRLDRIGDFVLWLDAAKAIRQLYPPDRYHITLLGSDSFASLACSLPYFDDVWEVNRERFVLDPLYRYNMIKKVASAGFSIALHPTWARDFLWGDAAIRASRAPERIGFTGTSPLMSRVARAISDRWYTRLIEGSPGSQMMLARNAEFVRGLGYSSFLASVPVLEVLGEEPQPVEFGPYYCVCPGASHAIRQWPVERFAALAQRVFEHSGWKGVICGAPADTELGRTLKALCSAPLVDYTGRTTLREFVEILAASRLVIGNESAAIHLAAASGVKSVCVLGGGHYGSFVPYYTGGPLPSFVPRRAVHPMECFGCDWECIYKPRACEPAPCITGVSVDDAWSAVLACLEPQAAALA